MYMINNDSLIAGYLTGTIKGQLENVEMLRTTGMSDKDILNYVLDRLKIALDTSTKLV